MSEFLLLLFLAAVGIGFASWWADRAGTRALFTRLGPLDALSTVLQVVPDGWTIVAASPRGHPDAPDSRSGVLTLERKLEPNTALSVLFFMAFILPGLVYRAWARRRLRIVISTTSTRGGTTVDLAWTSNVGGLGAANAVDFLLREAPRRLSAAGERILVDWLAREGGCGRCGAKLLPDDRYCPSCGEQQVAREAAPAPATAAPDQPRPHPTAAAGVASRCPGCGTEVGASHTTCPKCGHAREYSRAERLAGLAFVLNELRGGRLRDKLPERARIDVLGQYLVELDGVLRPPAAPAVSPPPRPATSAAPTGTPAARPKPSASAAAGPPPVSRAVPARPALAAASVATAATTPAVRPPSPPRKPPVRVSMPSIDWHWLAEQQANLFLFAGAFLVVVAALIYVAYPGQAIDGGLKVGLFAAYNAAFLAAGWACLRQPKVRLAGRVFLAIGAVLVPMNFIVAQTMLSDENLDPEKMWLAGSAVTAAFYTALAAIGTGRSYAYGAAVALVSAVMAVVVVSAATGEWVPVALLALAVALSGFGLIAKEPARNRIGPAWDHAGLIVAAGAVVGAFLVLGIANGAARWYLLSSGVLLAAFAAVEATRGRRFAAAVVAVGFACAGTGVAYGFEWPLGYYAVTTAVAAGMACAFAWQASSRVAWVRRGREDLFDAAAGLACLALVLAAGIAVLDSLESDLFAAQSPWFLAATALLAGGVFAARLAVAPAGRREVARAAGVALLVVVGGVPAAGWYGLQGDVGFYASAFVIGAAAEFWGAPYALRRLQIEQPEAGRDGYIVANAFAVAGALWAAGLVWAASSVPDYELGWRGQPAVVGGLLAVFFGSVVWSGRRPIVDAQALPFLAGVTAFSGAAAGIAYAVEGGSEYYGIALAAGAALAMVVLRWGVPRLPDRQTADVPGGVVLVYAGSVAAAVLSIATAGNNTRYSPDSPWFLPATFGVLLAAFAAFVTCPRPLAGSGVVGASTSSGPSTGSGRAAVVGVSWMTVADRAAAYAAALALLGTIGGLFFALGLPEETGSAALVIAAGVTFATMAWGLPRADRVVTRWALEADATLASDIGLAVGAAFVSLAAVANAGGNATIDPIWLLPASFAGVGLVLAMQLVSRIEPFAESAGARVAALSASLVGVSTGLVYAFGGGAEFYALAFAAPGAAILSAVSLGVPRAAQALLPADWREYAGWTARAAVVTGVAVAAGTALVASDTSSYQPETRWFLAGTFAIALVAAAFDAWREPRGSTTCAVGLAVVGVATGIVYGVRGGSEYYGLAFAVSTAICVSGVRWLVPRLPAGRHSSELRPTGIGLAYGGAVAAAVIALSTAVNVAYAADSRWFVSATYAFLVVAFGLYLNMRRPVFGEADRGGLYALATALTAMLTGVVYAAEMPPEAAAAPPLLAGAVVFAIGWQLPVMARVLPRRMLEADATILVNAGQGLGAAWAVTAVLATSGGGGPRPETAWLLPVLFGAIAALYAAQLASRIRPFPAFEEPRVVCVAASVLGVTTGLVYALGGGAEYYAFAFVATGAAILGTVLAGAPKPVQPFLPDNWEAPAAWSGRVAVAAGVAVAAVTALVASDASLHQPETNWFLAVVFGVALLATLFDARRVPGMKTTLSASLMTAGTAFAVAYGAGADAEYCGIALAGVALAGEFGGRVWWPRWLDRETARRSAVTAVTVAWLIEPAYAAAYAAGAAVHFSAAFVYAAWAARPIAGGVDWRSDGQALARAVFGRSWIYAAAFVASVGYLYFLGALPQDEAGVESAAIPVGVLTLLFAGGAHVLRRRKLEAGWHVYVVALIQSAWSVSIAQDATVASLLLAVFIVVSLGVAVVERAPLAAIPAIAYGFLLVPAVRAAFDLDAAAVPVGFTVIGLAYYAAGLALRGRAEAAAIRGVGALYLVTAPAAGLAMVAASPSLTLGSAAYQWAAAATCVAGAAAVIESIISGRRWVAVPGTAVMAGALLLGVLHFEPNSAQPYAVPVGLYLVALGVIGLRRLRLVPGLERSAGVFEALGAAVVMTPAWLQSLEGGWQFQLALLAEAVAFFVLAVVLRRRVLLATASLFLVLLAGHALFDAINALPNWATVAAAGTIFLAAGFGILLGRERWDAWQERLRGWWEEDVAGDGAAVDS